jgi:hypothetical protein
MEITCNSKTQTRKTLNYDMKLSTAKRPSPILQSSCSLLAHDCNGLHSRPLHPKYLGFGFGLLSEWCGLAYLKMQLRLLFKMFFVLKCIKMMFFYFLKIIFETRSSKRSETYKKNLILAKKKWIFWERGLHRIPKRPRQLFFCIFFSVFMCSLWLSSAEIYWYNLEDQLLN